MVWQRMLGTCQEIFFYKMFLLHWLAMVVVSRPHKPQHGGNEKSTLIGRVLKEKEPRAKSSRNFFIICVFVIQSLQSWRSGDRH